jgi:hypothetical protein
LREAAEESALATRINIQRADFEICRSVKSYSIYFALDDLSSSRTSLVRSRVKPVNNQRSSRMKRRSVTGFGRSPYIYFRVFVHFGNCWFAHDSIRQQAGAH